MSRTTDSDTSLFTPIDWDVLYSACKSLTQVRSLRLLHLVRHCARLVLRGHLTVTSQEYVYKSSRDVNLAGPTSLSMIIVLTSPTGTRNHHFNHSTRWHQNSIPQ